jgi:hypothetical protein
MRLFVTALGSALRCANRVPDPRARRSFKRSDQDPAVSGVGNRDSACVQGNFLGVPQCRGCDSRFFYSAGHRLAISFVGHRQQVFEEWTDHVHCELTGVRSHHVTFPVYYDQRRPGSHRIGAPDAELPIVDYRVGQSKAKRGFKNPGCLALRDIFAAVYSDDDNVIRISLFDLPQLRENMDAIDSAIGPEIEKHYLAAQLLDTQCLAVGMNPIETLGKIGSSNARKIGNRL